MIGRIGFALALMGGAATVAQAGGDVVVKPRQEVHLTKDAWGCLSKDNLDSVLSHERDGQAQAKQQYFDDYRCVSVPDGARFRVVSVDRDDVQFVSADNSDQQGLWTDVRFVRPVRP
ncbi:surface attachment protein Sap1 [Burkholderia glumae]|uniref:Uncharacterized protein n=1 Tax=Burkholderia glumae TaxID=337 RepID=A0AAP9Y0E7_BURGL|nr:hypothetical protein [Burkholderia glumae]ACR30485.1 Hypothetical protein bglu_1g34230 [Burkholderia glumae BGR1]AJY65852.1 hypothetical protein KS03_886 [Burkholderia glumae LMG 2196 = ATCC 33617]KHJ60064.1 hypothetical protein NCPPB3923_26045 [Burkholderia glumae]MCM2481845.1 hypothetical protein [Burkholderia glumae]MCM2491549.1 hypothetical protein [Burkholderia glumae]